MKRLGLGILCGSIACGGEAIKGHCGQSFEHTLKDSPSGPDAVSAVSAMLGEASNQNFSVMLAIACAIRNRGTLQGVYGLHNPVVKRAPHKVRKRATRAWLASAATMSPAVANTSAARPTPDISCIPSIFIP